MFRIFIIPNRTRAHLCPVLKLVLDLWPAILRPNRKYIMPKKIQQLISNYCEEHEVVIPSGFARHTPSRYVIVRTHCEPPKLIAATWFSTADVVYYIDKFLLPELGELLAGSIRILDFQGREELAYTGTSRLKHVKHFEVSEEGCDAH